MTPSKALYWIAKSVFSAHHDPRNHESRFVWAIDEHRAIRIFDKITGEVAPYVQHVDGAAVEDAMLVCPRCHTPYSYLHHHEVKIFSRCEDAEQIRLTTVNDDKTTVAIASNGGNPSARRDGLSVSFSCELCGAGNAGETMQLNIAQHKGVTEISWWFLLADELIAEIEGTPPAKCESENDTTNE